LSTTTVGLLSTASIGVGALATLLMGLLVDRVPRVRLLAAGPIWGLIGLVAAGAVLAPLGEELLFRGIVFGGLRRYGLVISTLVSAVLFGLAHGINVVLPAAIVLGVLNALLYHRSRSIWPSIVSHAVNNTIVFVTVAILL